MTSSTEGAQTPIEPNRERIQLWVDALRSGEFVQGRNYLNCNGRFCCLGVACEVAKRNGLVLVTEVHRGGKVSYGGSVGVMSCWVANWFGLPDINPMLTDGDGAYHQASTWNDDLGATFDDIANMIENTYLKGEA